MRARPCLGGALAAHLGATLLLGLDGVHDLHERGHHRGHLRGLLDQRVGRADGGSQVGLVSARAAAGLGARLARAGVARGALAHELALGLGASDGLLALPVALGGLAHRGAHSVGSIALGAAVGRGAHSLALGAVLLLAQVLRAANVALRLVAVDLALGALSLLAVDLALRALADGVAHSGAHRVVALPSALRVAVTSRLGDGRHEVSLGDDGHGQRGQQDDQQGRAHGDRKQQQRNARRR